jgi:hypothetical protein
MAETSKESKKEKPDDMTFRNNAVMVINSLVNENKKMRESMTKAADEAKKNKKKESAASRIQGLQTLKNTLGSPTKPNYKK